jgi:hypothetical protein
MSTPTGSTAGQRSAEANGAPGELPARASSDAEPRTFDRYSAVTVALLLFCAWSITCAFLVAVSP